MLSWLTDDGLPVGLRMLGAVLTAFLIASVGGKWIIAWLQRRSLRERTDKTPIEDEKLRAQINTKSGTPTMGGLLMMAGLLPACLLWGRLSDPYLWMAIGCFLALAALGMADDLRKLTGKGHRDRGLKVRHKLLIQGAIGGALGALVLLSPDLQASRLFALEGLIPLGGLTVLWFALVIATMSNAVNVTDGLDGLAGGVTLVALVPLGVLAMSGPHGELAVFAGALFGGVVGFLWHNWHPARVFMGDTGSLALGGSIGLLALLNRAELLLPLIALVALVEFGSSVLQVLWFKATGRRILPIAPIHHLFQQKGWPETHIVARFCLVAVVVMLGTCFIVVW